MKPNAYPACEMCDETHSVLIRCRMCGAHVCPDCISKEANVCSVCFETRCYICKEYLSSRACNLCGVLVCEDHGLKRNEATICANCQAK